MADNQPTTSGVYVIRCTVTGRPYVGSAVDLANRQSCHWSMLRKGIHTSIKLQRGWNKYGEDQFTWEVLEFVEPARLIEREQFHIDRLNAAHPRLGFNVAPKAGSSLGYKHTLETRAKLSATHMGYKPSPESVAKGAATRRGRKATDEHRAKVSAALLGRKLSPQHCASISVTHKGLKRSAEAKAKTSASLRGRKLPSEQRAKMSIARHEWWRRHREAKAAAPKRARETQGTLFD